MTPKTKKNKKDNNSIDLNRPKKMVKIQKISRLNQKKSDDLINQLPALNIDQLILDRTKNNLAVPAISATYNFKPGANIIKAQPSKPITINLVKKILNFFSLKNAGELLYRPFKILKREKQVSAKTSNYSPHRPQDLAIWPEDEVEDVFAQPTTHYFKFLKIPRNWHKQLAVFILISVIIILPLQTFSYYRDMMNTKDRVLLMTNEAIDDLKSGQQSIVAFDLDAAGKQFESAKNSFNLAAREINNLNYLTSEIINILPGQSQSLKSGLALLAAGQIVSEAGQILINNGQNFLSAKSLTDYYRSLVEFNTDLKTVINKYNEAKLQIQSVKTSDLPADRQADFKKIISYLPIIEKGLTDINLINDSLLRLLGHYQWQRYILVFLNNNELRGGGGFMGSFALLDLDRGEIKKLEVPGGGTYDLQGSLIPKVISPDPLHLINSRWEFQDANWWPDYPATAKKVQWFYQNSNGPSVDGVVMFTSTLMERLLEIYGPIPMPEYSRVITAQNFVSETQKIVELEYDKEKNKPKQFIGDLTPKLLEKIFTSNHEQLLKLFGVIKDGLNQKHLLVYFNDGKIENIISDFGWNSSLKSTQGDYLSVINTNVAGGKTDGVIKEIINHQSEVQSNGSIIDTVKLIRRHNGLAGKDVFTGVQNNDYVRFYVPAGSTLIEAKGFKAPPPDLFEKPRPEYTIDLDLISMETEKSKDLATGMDIYKESGKTVFGNWLQLKPGEIQETTIKYRLPLSLSLTGQNKYYYSLLVQKQPGSLGSELHSNLILNNQYKVLAKFPADLASDATGISFNSNLITDQFYGAILIK
jgi:hypothetical protein